MRTIGQVRRTAQLALFVKPDQKGLAMRRFLALALAALLVSSAGGYNVRPSTPFRCEIDVTFPNSATDLPSRTTWFDCKIEAEDEIDAKNKAVLLVPGWMARDFPGRHYKIDEIRVFRLPDAEHQHGSDWAAAEADVTKAYLELLRRPPDGQGLHFHTRIAYEHGIAHVRRMISISREAVALVLRDVGFAEVDHSLLQSCIALAEKDGHEEMRRRLESTIRCVQEVFHYRLGRAAEEDAIVCYVLQIFEFGYYEVARRIAVSPESVQHVFYEELGRMPEEDAVATYVRMAEQHGIDAVREDIRTSREGSRMTFYRLLERWPEQTAEDCYYQIGRTLGSAAVVSNIKNSMEYRLKHPADR